MARDLREAIALPQPRYPSAALVSAGEATGALRHLGLDVEPEGPWGQGQDLRITHYLRVEEPFARPHALVVELVDADGRRLSSEAHAPAEGRVPTDRWRRGQIWADRHSLRLPHRIDPRGAETSVELELRVGLVSLGGAGAATSTASAGGRPGTASIARLRLR